MIHIDHICLAVRNLYEGAQRLREETGLGSFDGGWFPGRGLANRIVPLGGDVYIEVESVIDVFELEAKKPSAVYFQEVTRRGDVFLGWCARPDTREETEAIAKRTNSTIVESALRTRPDGTSVVAVRVPETTPCWQKGLPNFFYRPDMSTHSSRYPVTDGTVKPQGVAWMELGGSAEEMSDWLGVPASSLPLRFNGKAPGLYAVAVKSDKGEIVIRRPSLLDV